MNMMYRSHSVTTKSTITTLLLLGIILILLIIDPLSPTSTRNCRCCIEAFQQRIQYHANYRAAATAAARVRRYSQTEYEHYSAETTETFSTAVEYDHSRSWSRSQSAATTNAATTDSSSSSCGVVVVACPKLNNHENDDDKFVFINSNEDIISSINNSIDSNQYDIASIWANSLEPKIPFHKGSRIWLEQKQQQKQQPNAFDRENTKVGVVVNGKKIGTVTSDFPMYYI